MTLIECNKKGFKIVFAKLFIVHNIFGEIEYWSFQVFNIIILKLSCNCNWLGFQIQCVLYANNSHWIKCKFCRFLVSRVDCPDMFIVIHSMITSTEVVEISCICLLWAYDAVPRWIRQHKHRDFDSRVGADKFEFENVYYG